MKTQYIAIIIISLYLALILPHVVFAQESSSVNSTAPIDPCGKMFVVDQDNSINYNGTKLIMTIQNYSIPIPPNYHAKGVMPQDTLSSGYINNIFTITGKSVQHPMHLCRVLNGKETYRITISNIGDKPTTFMHYYLDYTITSKNKTKVSEDGNSTYYAYTSYGTRPLSKASHHNGRDVEGSGILRESDPSFGYMETPDTGWKTAHLNPNQSIAIFIPVEYDDRFTLYPHPNSIGNYTIQASTTIRPINGEPDTEIYSQPIELTLISPNVKYATPETPHHTYQNNISPRQQMKNGILPDNVICYEGKILIKKLSTNSIACVKPQTAQKLVERGWELLTGHSTTSTANNRTNIVFNATENEISHDDYNLVANLPDFTKEKSYLNMETKVHGFSGMYFDDNRILNVYTADSKITSIDKGAFFGIVDQSYLANGIIVKHSKHSWHKWLELNEIITKLLDKKDLGITSMGVDDKNQVYLVGFERLDNSTTEKVNKFLTEHKIPYDMVKLVETGKLTPLH